MTVERLSWASGPVVVDGWHHSDVQFWPGMKGVQGGSQCWDHFGPIQDGLPWNDATFAYVVSHHGLMMLPEPDLIPALSELRRVTKPGGWLRVSVPDMQLAIAALQTRDEAWFPLEAPDVETAFCRYVTQNGATRSIFTPPRLRSLLTDAGWQADPSSPFLSSPYRSTYSPHLGITDLDSRPNESLFMEAVNGT